MPETILSRNNSLRQVIVPLAAGLDVGDAQAIPMHRYRAGKPFQAHGLVKLRESRPAVFPEFF